MGRESQGKRNIIRAYYHYYDDDAAAAGASGPGQDASGRARSGQPQMSNVTDAAAMLALTMSVGALYRRLAR